MMGFFAIAALLTACVQPDESPVQESVLVVGGGAPGGIGLSYRPDLLVDLKLPPHSRPPDQPSPQRWKIQGEWKTLGAHADVVEFAAAKPYRIVSYGVEKKEQLPGMKIEVNGSEPLSFRKYRKRKPGPAGTWGLRAKQVVVRLPPGSEAPSEAWLTLPAATKAERSLNLDTSGLDREHFVFRTLDLTSVRAHGLYLPAPATAEFKVEVPPSGVFQAEGHLLSPAVTQGVESNGAAIVVSVVASGGTTELARKVLAPGEHQQIRLDLSAWAGETVGLQLSTQTQGDPAFDYVFLTDPVIYTPEETPRRTLFVLVDTMRQDHFGAYGYPRDISPNVDTFAKTAVVFDQARAPAPWTLPSSLAALYGRTPELVRDQSHLGELLGRTGWASCAVISNNWLIGPDTLGSGWTEHWGKPQSPASKQARRAARCLKDHSDRNTLLFVHMIDPHIPYAEARRFRDRLAGEAPRGLRHRIGQKRVLKAMAQAKDADEREAIVQYLIDRYDQNVMAVDEAFGELLELVGPSAVVVLTSDHGEEFFEHGGYEHGHTLFDELMLVPLMIRTPALDAARVAAPVALMDIVPTLLELLEQPGLAAPRGGHTGVSLVPVAQGVEGASEGLQQRPLAMGRPYRADDHWGVLMSDRKWVSTGGSESVYDLAMDPDEQHDIAETPDADLSGYPGLLSQALRRPVQRVVRVVGDGVKREMAGGPCTIKVSHPQGIEAAWIRMDPNDEYVAPVLEEGRVVVPVVKGRKTPKEVFVLLPEAASPAGLTVTRVNTDSTVTATVAPDEQRDGTTTLANAGDARTGFKVDLTWQPLPEAAGGIVYSGEVTEDLRALGYIE